MVLFIEGLPADAFKAFNDHTGIIGGKVVRAVDVDLLQPDFWEYWVVEHSSSFFEDYLFPVLESTDNLVDFVALLHSVDYLPEDSDLSVVADFLSRYRMVITPDVQENIQFYKKQEPIWQYNFPFCRNPVFLDYLQESEKTTKKYDYYGLKTIWGPLFTAPEVTSETRAWEWGWTIGYCNFYLEAVVNAFLDNGFSVVETIDTLYDFYYAATVLKIPGHFPHREPYRAPIKQVLVTDWVFLFEEMKEFPKEWAVEVTKLGLRESAPVEKAYPTAEKRFVLDRKEISNIRKRKKENKWKKLREFLVTLKP